jgi:nicotinamidase-related amidase
MKTALLVIDIQQALVDAHPAHSDAFLLNVDLLIHAAHNAGKEVIYVRHDGGAGDELEVNTRAGSFTGPFRPNRMSISLKSGTPAPLRKQGLRITSALVTSGGLSFAACKRSIASTPA